MKYSKTLGSVALSALLLTGMTGCGSDSDPVTFAPPPPAAETPALPAGEVTTTPPAAEVITVLPAVETPAPPPAEETPAPLVVEETITPYTRVAVLSQSLTGDENATVRDAAIEAVADKIAHYVTLTDETNTTGHAFPSGWVIAGAKITAGGETYTTKDLLPIPSAGTAAGGKGRVLEFCNGKYANMAINTGRFHGSALPCEVSVHSDGTKIYIDMLNADAIFSLFFADLSDDAKAAVKPVANIINGEIREMILAALNDTTVTAQSPLTNSFGITENAAAIKTAIPYAESNESIGPKFTQDDIDTEVALLNPYIIFEYRSSGKEFTTKVEDKALAKSIINTMGENGTDIYTNVPGISDGSGWRSARESPIPIPKLQLVEACSKKYATKATILGNEFLTALPCEFSVFVDENDPTILTISLLSPSFMFDTMFKGAVEEAFINGEITQDDVIEYSTLADVILSDLRLIIDKAVNNYDDTLVLQTPIP